MHALCKKDNIINVPLWNLFCVSFNYPVNLLISMCLLSYDIISRHVKMFTDISFQHLLQVIVLTTSYRYTKFTAISDFKMADAWTECGTFVFLESYLKESAGLGRSDFFTQQGPRERDNQANSIVDDDISEFFSP